MAWRLVSYEDGEDGGDYSPASIDARVQGYGMRLSLAMHPGNLPGPTSVQEVYTDEDVARLRSKARQSILALQQEMLVHPPAEALYQKGDTLDLREYIQGRTFVGMSPMDFGSSSPATPAPRKALARDLTQAWDFGSMIGMRVIDGGAVASRQVGDLGARDARQAIDLGARDSRQALQVPLVEEEPDGYEPVPRRPGTLVDSMSVISLLNQPRPLTMADVDSLLARVGRKDPFARAAFGKAPPAILLPATAAEVQRVLTHELGVDLTFEGHDFSRPSDIFESFRGRGRVPTLDAPRQKLVDALVGWGSAVAVANKLAPVGNFDLEQPFGFNWVNRSMRDPSTGLGETLGRIRGAVGEVLSPYLLDVKTPLLDYLMPDGRGPAADRHPVQSYLHDVGGFLLDFILPGMNVHDGLGARWAPGAAGSSTYQTVNRLRAEFGAPEMAILLGDDAQFRAVSVDPQPRPFGYSRGWFGMDPFGKELDRWSALSGAFEAGKIRNPELGPKSTLSRLQFWGGTWQDPYRGDSTFTIEPLFKFHGIEEKNGKSVFKATHLSPFQLDHVLPLSYAWQHGYDQLAAKVLDLLSDLPQTPKTERVTSRPLVADLAYDGQTVRQVVGGGLSADDTTGAHARAKTILELLARVGDAANPNQYALVSAALNQAKGDKGPSRFLPYGWAANAVQHRTNVAYVARWRDIVAGERAKVEQALGPMPDFLRLDREDELAMRRVELGIDTYPRLLRPFGSAYVEFIDSPSLLEPGLYRQIQATKLMISATFALGLSTWPLKPWNRVYLAMREHLLRGFWDHAFPAGAAFDLKAAPLGGRLASWANWYRDRWAGVPFVGRTASAVGDDALLAMHDLARSGKTVASVDRWGEVLESGAGGRVVTGTPGQFWRYFRGHDDPFGSLLSLRESEEGSRTLLFSKPGVQALHAEPLLLEVLQKLREGEPAAAGGHFLRDMLVKVVDYGGRGLFGVGGGLGNMNPARLAPILAVESMANLAGRFTGATTSIPLQFAPWRFEGGIFRWMDQQGASRLQALEDAHQRLRALEQRSAALAASFQARRAAGTASRAEAGVFQSLARRRVRVESEVASALFQHTSFQRLLQEEGAWLQEARDMPGLVGRATRFAMEHPRSTAAVTRVLARTPAHLAAVAKAPFVFHANLTAAIEGSKVLRRGLGGLNLGLQVFGIVEARVRYNRARELARKPYFSLSTSEKGELDAYLDPGTPRQVLGQMFLDAGGPLAVPATPLQWLKAAPGFALAVGNQVAAARLRGVARADTSYANAELERLVANAPRPSEVARQQAELTRARNRGFLTQSMLASNPFARATVDTASVFASMRAKHAELGDSEKAFDKRMAAARRALTRLPEVDSLGYQVAENRFGKTMRKAFPLAPQFAADVSLAPMQGRFDTAVVVKPAARLDSTERARRLFEEASKVRHAWLVEERARETSFWKRVYMLRLLDTQYKPRYGSDSADLARDLQQRRQRAGVTPPSSRPR